MMVKVYSILLLSLFCGCTSRGQRQGVVIVHTYFFENHTGTSSLSLKIDTKIVFKENLSIQEVPLINFSRDLLSKSVSAKIKQYSYLDSDKNLCLTYKTFSDTAAIFKHYNDIDSVKVDGGWNFLSNKKIEYSSLIPFSDTVIAGIRYGRFRLNRKFNNADVFLVLYTSCTRINPLIRLFKSLSDSVKCPIVRDDTFTENSIFMIRELEFVCDELSKDELRVFEAWERNAREKLLTN